MKTAKQWALELPPDVLEHPMPFPARLDYAEAVIKRAQAEAVAKAQQDLAIWQRWHVDATARIVQLERIIRDAQELDSEGKPSEALLRLTDAWEAE